MAGRTRGAAAGEGPAGGAQLPPFGHSVGCLLSQAGAATAGAFKAALAEVAIEPRQFAIMRAIAAAENRSQQLLAESLQIPASSMVAILDHLEARGLLRRHLDPTDRRVRILEPTRDGRAVLGRAVEIAIGTESRICSGLRPDERELLITLLQRVASNLGLTAGIHPDLDGGGEQPCGR